MATSNRIAVFALLVCITTKVSGDVVGFDIVVKHGTPLTPAEQAAFDAAEQTWESLISGYQDSVLSTVLTIESTFKSIDGEGGALGSALPTSAEVADEGNFLYARTGMMEFDRDDISALLDQQLLDDVILHEMGHVLGIGTLWSTGFQELYVHGSGRYTGSHALSAYRAEFDSEATFVPVELDGGPGTANSHWNETEFGDELMTGFISGETFISGVTLGAVADLGYSAVPAPTVSIGLISLALASVVARSRWHAAKR